MDVIDVNKENFQEVDIKGHMALFTELRVDKSTIPEGMNCYELRHGDDDSYPAALEQGVRVNYFGAVFMTDKVELGQDGYIPLEYEDFGFTGENLSAAEYLANYGEEPEHFASGAELVRFMEDNGIKFQMSEKEAEVLLGYLSGHDFQLGGKDGKLYRGDLDYAQEEIRWTADTIDDVINTVYEWNDDMIQHAQAQVDCYGNFSDYEKNVERLESLKADEQLLDVMFDRTKYGKELLQLAEKLADDFIRDMQSKGGIDGAIERMTEAIKEGKDLLPEVSPALKKDTGAR